MNESIETFMYGVSQLFLVPVLAAIGVLFLYAFYALGAFLWQAAQRRAFGDILAGSEPGLAGAGA